MPVAPILIACVGNIFLGDDGFGVEVAKRLSSCELPNEARLADFGIRSFDLTYALLDGYEVTILVDATARGGRPGTLYVIEPDLDSLDEGNPSGVSIDPHVMDPMKVLRMVRSMGGKLGRILLVGCEPETLGGDEGQLGLSPSVEAAVDEAVGLIESLVTSSLEGLEALKEGSLKSG